MRGFPERKGVIGIGRVLVRVKLQEVETEESTVDS